MFGYVKINKPELKIREYDRYRGFYCGLCRSLKKQHGRLGQLTLTYDMTFLVMMLSSLYEPRTTEVKKTCLVHPGKKQMMLQNEISQYAADMNVLLTHDHFEDDWNDEHKVKSFLAMKLYKRKKKRIERKYARQSEVVRKSLEKLAALEKNNCKEIDEIARPFGELLSELFVWKEDAFQNILRPFGFYLGKYIYLLDAYLDLEVDEKKGCFNPFLERSQEDNFEEEIKAILDHTMRMAIAEFEKLPLEQDLSILRNILYEGVWIEFERKRKKYDGSI